MIEKTRWIAAALLALVATCAGAADWKTLPGQVVGVVDGDTLDLLDADRKTHRIRLMGIDAPERRQPFGSVAKQNLANLTFGRDVVLRWRHRDRDGRILAQVFAADQDVNLKLVTDGLAWWYRTYSREQLPADRTVYSDAEAAARVARAGLWADPDPVAPWEFRHRKR